MKQFSILLLILLCLTSNFSYSQNNSEIIYQSIPYDVAVGPFLSFPASFTAGNTHVIRARVENLGTNPQNFVPIRFSINGLILNTNTIPGMLPGAIDSSSFNWTPQAAGNYTLKIFSGAAFDDNRFNDTVTATVIVIPFNPNPPHIFCKNGLSILIPSIGSANRDTITVNVSPLSLIMDINVKIDTVLHTSDSDLVFNLRHNNQNVNFINSVGGGNDNFIGTVLDDSSSVNISNGTAPFTGTFKPSSPLQIFNGQLPSGTWILEITDNVSGNTGILKGWCLHMVILIYFGGIQTIEIPNYYSLSQNYPNPFNPTTSIRYSVPNAVNVTLKVFDVLGKEIITLVNEMKQPGFYTADFDASGFASGIYFYRIDAGEFSSVMKMILVQNKWVFTTKSSSSVTSLSD